MTSMCSADKLRYFRDNPCVFALSKLINRPINRMLEAGTEYSSSKFMRLWPSVFYKTLLVGYDSVLSDQRERD